MKIPARLAATVVMVAGLVATPALADPAVPSFYAAAAKLSPEGKLGRVVKAEEIATQVPDARAWRIAYVSSDVGENPTMSTAVVVAPKGAPPPGGRPVIAWSHGTTGTAQNCGPSQIENPAKDLNEYFLVGGDSWTDYGMPALTDFIRAGYVVVATDYQGLGAGGKHQYAVAATQARDVINSVRAVAAMKETGAGKDAIVYGWSQGGGSTLAAANLPDYIARHGTAADGVRFLGFVALAPFDVEALTAGKTIDAATAPKMLADLAAGFSANVFDFTHFAMTMWGTQAAFPGLKLGDIFTAEGAGVVDAVYSNKCMHASADTVNYAYGSNYKTLLATPPANALAWMQALVKGSVVPVKPVAPVVIYWGTKDTVMAPIMGKLYQDQMCKLGGNVGRVQLAGEQTHFSTPGAAAPLYVAWIKDRIAGVPLANGCPAN